MRILRKVSLMVVAALTSTSFCRRVSGIMVTRQHEVPEPRLLTTFQKKKQDLRGWKNNIRLAERRGNSRPLLRGK